MVLHLVTKWLKEETSPHNSKIMGQLEDAEEHGEVRWEKFISEEATEKDCI